MPAMVPVAMQPQPAFQGVGVITSYSQTAVHDLLMPPAVATPFLQGGIFNSDGWTTGISCNVPLAPPFRADSSIRYLRA